MCFVVKKKNTPTTSIQVQTSEGLCQNLSVGWIWLDTNSYSFSFILCGFILKLKPQESEPFDFNKQS